MRKAIVSLMGMVRNSIYQSYSFFNKTTILFILSFILHILFTRCWTPVYISSETDKDPSIIVAQRDE